MLNLANIPAFHTGWLEKIKRELKATHVSYVNNKEGYFIRVIKDKEEVRFKLTGTPRDVTKESYEAFLNLAKEHYNEQVQDAV